MPKKISTNPKAVEARERKANQKKEKQDAEERKKEDGKFILQFSFIFSYNLLIFEK